MCHVPTLSSGLPDTFRFLGPGGRFGGFLAGAGTLDVIGTESPASAAPVLPFARAIDLANLNPHALHNLSCNDSVMSRAWIARTIYYHRVHDAIRSFASFHNSNNISRELLVRQ